MERFMHLDSNDLAWCLRRLPKPVKSLLKSQAECILAGGFIRSCIAGEPVQDIDLFAPSPKAAEHYAQTLAKPLGVKVFTTGNAHSLRIGDMQVQVIHRWSYASLQECVDSFDFTIARAAIHMARPRDANAHWASICDSRFYVDLAAKRLVYCAPQRNEDAGGSMLRVLKFYQRGYRIPLDSLGAVMARMIGGVVSGDQLFWRETANGKRLSDGEVEKYRAAMLTGLLHEVDPAIDPGHLAHLPSSSEQWPLT